MHDQTAQREALAAFGFTSPLVIQPILQGGHINQTFEVQLRDRFVILQQLSPIFSVDVVQDFAAISQFLSNLAFTSPRLLPTCQGQWYYQNSQGAVYRVQTKLPGEVLTVCPSPQHAHSAGHLLGRLHRLLGLYPQPLQSKRLRVHDLPYHLDRLQQALDHYRHRHDLYAEVAKLSQKIFSLIDILGISQDDTLHLVHGDPKLGNVLFCGSTATAWIDFDTFNYLSLTVELGDALRSFCNVGREDQLHGEFSRSYFVAFLQGYLQGSCRLLGYAQWQQLAVACAQIGCELASRFGRDALYENYFAFDAQRFARSGLHQLQRAKAQLALAQSILQQRHDLEADLRAMYR